MDNEQKAMALGLVGVLLVGAGLAGLAGILPLEITGVSVSVVVSSYHECSGAYRVLFNATVSGGVPPYSYRWTIYSTTDGDLSLTSRTAEATYAAPGVYGYKIQVLDANGTRNSDFDKMRYFNLDVQPISASFTWTADTTNPRKVSFAGEACGGNPPYRTWTWDFGDLLTGSGQSISHEYASDGYYSVRMTVVDAWWTGRSVFRVVHAGATTGSSGPLQAAFEYAVGFLGVSFTASASGGSGMYTYAWAFGDGASGSGKTASHSYGSAGTYSVTLTVKDTAAQTKTVTRSVTVALGDTTPPPPPPPPDTEPRGIEGPGHLIALMLLEFGSIMIVAAVVVQRQGRSG